MFSLKIQNFEPRKLAKNLAVNVEKRIQFTGRCTMKVSEREISRQMKVRKTAVPNTIKKISKNKVFLTFICLDISRSETFIVQRPVN